MRLDALSEYIEYIECLELEDYLLLATALLLPWAFGGVEIWAYRSASLLLAAAASVAIAKRGFAGLGLDRKARWLVPAFALAAWAAVQVVPLPSPVLRALSPKADEVYRQTFPGYPGDAREDLVSALEQDALRRVEQVPGYVPPQAGERSLRVDVGGRWSGWRTLSVQPTATVERLFWFVALLLGFLIVRSRTMDPDRARVYRTAMFVGFCALALFAMVQAVTWNGKIFWVRAVPHGVPFGPYVNFVHFGGVMELAVPWLAGYAWMKFRRPEGPTVWRSIAPVVGGTTVLCFVAGLSSTSKMVAMTMPAALVVLAAVAVRGWRRKLAVAAGAVVVWGGGMLLLLPTALGERVRSLIEARAWGGGGSRPAAWEAGFSVIRDYLLTGSGFGTFQNVYPAYLPAGEYERWGQLHNDYLELLLEGGLVAAILTVWLLWGWSRRSVRGLRRGERGRIDLETLGLLLGVGTLAVHGLVDFNHQIPGNALLFVVAAAVAVARGEDGGRAGP